MNLRISMGKAVTLVVTVGWLVVVWVLLWARADLLVLVSGALVAALTMLASRYPVVPGRATVRWRRLPGLLGRFGLDLVSSSVAVTRDTVRSGPRTRAAVFAVDVPRGSDLELLAVTNRISLVPGTVVVDVDHDRGRIFVYSLGVDDEAGVEAARESARAAARDVMAFLRPGAEEETR